MFPSWNHKRPKGPHVNVLTAPGKRLFLSGDEAVARAALELGVQVVTGYPGNPSTKTITALIPLARQYGMAVEWSVNEKVALEVATGAAGAGRRSLVTMKMSGVNVMADSLLSIAHSGVTGALVIYAVDDVGAYYGMVEQDSRHYALLASLPLLMPASPEEAYAMTRLAFVVSEQTGAPVIILSTTAVANAITALKVGKIERGTQERPASFQRNLAKFTKAVPQWCRDQHADAILRLEQAGDFFKELDVVLVLEELEPIIETAVLALIAEEGLRVKVLGKRDGLLPRVGDYSPEIVEQAIAELTGRSHTAAPFTSITRQHIGAQSTQNKHAAPPPRSLEFCPGCPHRLTYYALNRAIERLGFTHDEVITTGDIGCTIIGMNAPLDACWTEVSMGASIGIAQGFKYAGIERPVLAAMGD